MMPFSFARAHELLHNPPVRTLGIDCRFTGFFAGIGRYTRELVTRLALREGRDFSIVLLTRSAEESWLRDLRALPNVRVCLADVVHYSLAEQLAFPGIIRRAGIDVLFSPHFSIPFACPVPYVVTIHDLILHRFPNQASFLRQAAYRFLLWRVVTCAERIIAVSNFTARELSQLYGAWITEKITVIPEGVGEEFAPAGAEECQRVRKAYGLPDRYFLYVGNAKEHKHVQTLIDAHASLGNDPRGLVLATGGKEAVRLRMHAGVQVLPEVREADLPALYSGADAFVTASHYEGFGLPAVEALACGCPVIAAARGATPEILGKDALLIEPAVEAFAQAMALADGSRRPPVRRFSWNRAAEATAALLKTLL